MNVLTVEVCPLSETPGVGVGLLVDGRDFRDLVRDFEAVIAGDLAGRYDLLPAAEALPPSQHFLGQPIAWYSSGDGRPYLLICECGEPGCWPLEASVIASADTVTWSGFRQPHRPQWSYADFGSFCFDRAQYEVALRDAAASIGPSNG
jgi:hypothetical protein